MKRDISICVLLLILAVVGSAIVYKIALPKDQEEKEESITMNIVVNNMTYQVELEDNKTVDELVEKLPLEINMQELNGNEKYYYFNDDFTVKSKNPNTINKGDLMLYSNNCLVLFYDTFDTHYSYTKIGHIKNADNLKEVLGSGDVLVRFEKDNSKL